MLLTQLVLQADGSLESETVVVPGAPGDRHRVLRPGLCIQQTESLLSAAPSILATRTGLMHSPDTETNFVRYSSHWTLGNRVSLGTVFSCRT